MKLAVFTSNQVRHAALVRALVDAGHEVRVTVEPKTWLLPEQPVLREYWRRVRAAEEKIFGVRCDFRVPTSVVKAGELSALDWEWDFAYTGLRPIVFSSSYITGALADAMIAAGALNLHVGIAPEYRGSAPNAFAHHDGNSHLIGAQVQRLSKGLDAGEIFTEVCPDDQHADYFMRSMRAVKLGIASLVRLLQYPEPWPTVRENDRTKQIRYARKAEFNETVAARIMETSP